MSTTGLREETERKNFYAPVSVIRRAEKIASANRWNLSHLIRIALENYISSLEKEDIKREVKAACRAYAKTDAKIDAEWAGAQTDPWE